MVRSGPGWPPGNGRRSPAHRLLRQRRHVRVGRPTPGLGHPRRRPGVEDGVVVFKRGPAVAEAVLGRKEAGERLQPLRIGRPQRLPKRALVSVPCDQALALGLGGGARQDQEARSDRAGRRGRRSPQVEDALAQLLPQRHAPPAHSSRPSKRGASAGVAGGSSVAMHHPDRSSGRRMSWRRAAQAPRRISATARAAQVRWSAW